MLSMPGAVEYEIAMLISEQAWRAAQRMIDEWEHPDDGADLFSRAVRACYRELQRRVVEESALVLRQRHL